MQSNKIPNETNIQPALSGKPHSLYIERLAELASGPLVQAGANLVENELWDAGGYYKPVTLGVEVDWTMNPFNDRTWRWFLHQFEFTRCLLAYDLAQEGERGYQRLKKYIQSWAYQYLYDLSDTDSVWHDHGTALRVRNMLLLVAFIRDGRVQDAAFLSEIISILKVHAGVLLKDSFYSKGTNHGLDQNIILFELLKELEENLQIPGALEIASGRVNYEIAKAFAPDGGHIENSAGYLMFGLKQAVDALHVGRSYDGDDSLIRLPSGLLERATNVLTHTIRPDGKLPLIGDTCDYIVRDIFRDVRPKNYKQFLYSAHQGARGSVPETNDLVLHDSGWAILRSSWDVSESLPFKDQLHCVFKSGFLSNYHRHDDDLSFVLFYKGKDWIIEGGLYKHSRTDPYRLFFRSALAHNISMPFRERASRILEDAGGTAILSHQLQDALSVVRAQSQMFPGFQSTRQLTYDRQTNNINIIDRIIPVSVEKQERIEQRVNENAITYVSRFQVPEDKIVSLDRENGICMIQDGGNTLSIKSNGSIAGLRVSKGLTKPEIKGWVSHRPNKLKPCHTIEFLYNGHSLEAEYNLVWS